MLHGYLGEWGRKGQALTGLRVLKFDGAVAPRVLKFDSGYAAEGCGGRLRRGWDRDRRGACLYSRRLTPCGRGLMAPPGLTALGAKGSACDRLRLTGGLRAFALGRYIVPLRWEGGRPFGRQHKCRLWRRKPDSRASPVGKPYNSPAGVGNAPLLVAGATTFPPAGGLYSSLCVSFILPLCTSCIGCASRSK